MSGRNASSFTVHLLPKPGDDEEDFYDFNKSVTRHRLVSQDSYSEEKEKEEEELAINDEDTQAPTTNIQDQDQDQDQDRDRDRDRDQDKNASKLEESRQREEARKQRRRAAQERFDTKVLRGLAGIKSRSGVIAAIYVIALTLTLLSGGFIVDRSMEANGILFLSTFTTGIVFAVITTAVLLGDVRAHAGSSSPDIADDESKEPLKSILGPEGMDTEQRQGESCCSCLSNTLVYLLQINQNAGKLLALTNAVLVFVIGLQQLEDVTTAPAVGVEVEAKGLLTAAVVFATFGASICVMDLLAYFFYHDEVDLVRGMSSTESTFEEISDTAEVITEMPEMEMEVFADENRAYLRATSLQFQLFFYPLSNHGWLVAVVCNDIAAVLLLSKRLVTVTPRIEEDIIAVVLLFGNAITWEVLRGFAGVYESFEVREPMAQLPEEEFEVEERLISSTTWLRSTLQRYADVHSSVVGLLGVPLLTALPLLSAGLITPEALLLSLLPFAVLFCFAAVLQSWSFNLCSCCSFVGLRVAAVAACYIRPGYLFPRVVGAGYAAALVVIEYEGLEIRTGVPPVVYIVHAAYLLAPLLLRFLSDIARNRGLGRTVRSGMEKNEVDFSGRSLTSADLLSITQSIGASPSEQDHLALRFQDVYPSLTAMRMLTHSLKHQKRSGGIFLDVSLNHIGVKGANVLGRLLMSASSRRVKGLGLGGNQIGSEGAEALAIGLEKNTGLETLFLEYNDIGNAGVEAIGKALEENHTLKALFSVGNNIGDSGAAALANALEMNETVAVLGLDQNQIGPDGAVNLVTALAHNYSLKSLSMNENVIRAEGAQALKTGLRENKSLTELHLSNNQIGDEGAIALGDGLRNNSTLLSFTLSKNKIGDEGAVGLGLGLKQNKALTDLNLNDNVIGPLGARQLVEALESNTTLRTLSLGSNRITGNVRQLLQDTVPRMKI